MKRGRGRIAAAFKAGDLQGTGHVAKLSRGGLFFVTDVLPKPGEAARIVFNDREGSKVTIEGIVRWNTAQLPPKESGFGLQIQGPREDYLEFYENMLLS
jgi:hypothetical protein